MFVPEPIRWWQGVARSGELSGRMITAINPTVRGPIQRVCFRSPNWVEIVCDYFEIWHDCCWERMNDQPIFSFPVEEGRQIQKDGCGGFQFVMPGIAGQPDRLVSIDVYGAVALSPGV